MAKESIIMLDEFHDVTVKFMKNNLIEDDLEINVLTVFSTNGLEQYVLNPGSHPSTSLKLIGKKLHDEEIKVFSFSVGVSTWFSTVDAKNAHKPRPRPKDDPNRKEAIVVETKTFDGHEKISFILFEKVENKYFFMPRNTYEEYRSSLTHAFINAYTTGELEDPKVLL